MKKTFLFLTAALLVAGAVSCNKNAASPVAVTDAPQGSLSVRIGVPEADTKALANAATVKDFQINSVQVFVFENDDLEQDGTERLETDYFFEPASPVSNSISVTLNTKTGSKVVYVLVNRNRMYCEQGTYTLGDFERGLVDLAENSLTGFVMSGKGEIQVQEYNKNKNPEQAAQTLNIWVRRLVAMVKLSSVNVDFSKSSLSGATFRITQMYLKNAVGKARLALYGFTDEAAAENVGFQQLPAAIYSNGDNWYNKHTLVSGCPSVLLDNTCNDSCAPDGTSTSIGRCLFTFPNKTLASADSHSSTWAPRLTRLTIKAHVTKNADGMDVDEDTYYTFDLPVLESNKVYNIQNINITQLGKADDDSDSEIYAGKLTPVITVDAWDADVINLNYEF